MAPALLGSAQMITGPTEKVDTVTFMASQGPDDLLASYADVVGEDEGEVLFLVDLFGGSPFNAAARFAAERPLTDVVAGVNLPMLIDVILRGRELPLAEAVTLARSAGTSGVRSFSEMHTTSNQDDEGDEL